MYQRKSTPLQRYLQKKIDELRKDFLINPTNNEIYHLRTLKTQTAIDNAILDIIDRNWYM